MAASMSFDFSPDVQPLAARMRPCSIEEYAGQQHLLAEGKPLRRAIVEGRVHSLILWGPPGTGKTTLAELIAKYANCQMVKLSAVTSGIKDIRTAIDTAKQNLQMGGQRTLLFIDEVHRFNKSQQDAFLPHIEDGTVIFIGATTENPSFELNNAILSRARTYLLQKLDTLDLQELLNRALTDAQRGLANQIILTDKQQKTLCDAADGDGRKLLNLVEICADLSDGVPNAARPVADETIATIIAGNRASYDKNGDQFYDLISAFHKSVRGSSADAALYWYSRILAGGGDPLYVARRLLAIASEDIGNADPRALQIGLNAWDIFHRVGPAEGERAIAQAAVYMALAPKSNAVYMAFNQAKSDAESLPPFEVPHHLRNAPTNLMKDLGYGAEYRYAHNEPGAYAAGERYLPPEMSNTTYYQPSDRGLEAQLGKKMQYLAERDVQSEQKRYESD